MFNLSFSVDFFRKEKEKGSSLFLERERVKENETHWGDLVVVITFPFLFPSYLPYRAKLIAISTEAFLSGVLGDAVE